MNSTFYEFINISAGIIAMRSILQNIYGKPKGEAAFSRITAVLDDYFEKHRVGKAAAFSQSDVILVTYGDMLSREGELPLQTLHRFLDEHVKEVFSGLHILPFFPYSSDDGFSVTDFFMVRPDLGSWANIRSFGGRFRLMVDLIANHVSAESRWFQNYLADQKGFEDLAIEVDPSTDLSMVTRPRSLPLLSEFKKHSGCKVYLWTTFSEDQIDLNYKSLHVLENMEHTRYALTNQSDFLKIDIKVLHYFLSSLFFFAIQYSGKPYDPEYQRRV